MKPNSKKGSSLEDKFAQQLMEAGFRGRYRRNALFIDGRKYKADFLFPSLHLVVEVDGGEWLGKRGGHTSGKGFLSDRCRDQTASLEHYQTVRYAGTQIKDGSAIAHLCQYAKVRAKEIEAFKAQGLI